MIGIIALICIIGVLGLGIFLSIRFNSWLPLIIVTILDIIIFPIFYIHTASGARAIKDAQSEINGGLEREITITAEDGREIFYYEGKVDIESNHEDNYIKFESEDGKRYIVYYGIQDTITIIEK